MGGNAVPWFPPNAGRLPPVKRGFLSKGGVRSRKGVWPLGLGLWGGVGRGGRRGRAREGRRRWEEGEGGRLWLRGWGDGLVGVRGLWFGVGRRFGRRGWGSAGEEGAEEEGVVVGGGLGPGPSFTWPSSGGGTPGAPGRCKGGVWRGVKCSLTVPGRGRGGGSPSREDMRGRGVRGVVGDFPTLSRFWGGPPAPPRSAPSERVVLEGGLGRILSIGTSTPPTMTAEVVDMNSLGGGGS